MGNCYDLIVVGGGFAGACAAMEAADNGLRVLLIDKNNCMGGAAARRAEVGTGPVELVVE